MALALGYLLGTRGAEPKTPAVAEPTGTSTATAAATATATTSAAADGGTPALNVADPKVGEGALLWGPSVPLSQLKEASQVHRRMANDPFAIGDVNAPVVISEFSDFECPFCSRHANQTFPELLKYVEDGTVRIEWNDFPINGPNAEAGAKAGRAAAEQGKFEEYKTAAFAASKDVQGHPNFGIEDFVKFAKQAGVPDLEQFRADATSDKYDDAIDHAKSYASSLGITGTPAFIIGETFVSGAQPISAFEEAITQELEKAGK
ncbi:DsbA-like protein [Corynebacterium phocae]|uniref:DsbA-like protein n=2 Tax=Corynebacterium phocae TaxID=161895 RepID=A0A1L7D617_9CORY|nr:DsbA-like protein [Corynebacterium phocae]KAA8728554.1 thioredoxin domain-containing protein [Corynebacterium phocae]